MVRITVANIEVVQAIQNVHNDVPLVAGKRSYVRVYLSASGVADTALITGHLSICLQRTIGSRPNRLIYQASSRPVRLMASMSLRDQRVDWTSSLNFQLPDALLKQAAGQTIIAKLERVTVTDAGSVCDAELVPKRATETGPITVVASPDMHCRIVMFRHRDAANRAYLQPQRGEAEAIRRYVENTFPVANVTWSSVDMGAPRNFRALGPIQRESRRTQEELTRSYASFFQYLLAIREQDILHGRDTSTLYLGLIADPSGRFGGAAMDSPQFAAPHVVTMTSADMEGDLGAHELAHALGRRHPGIPDCQLHGYVIGQRKEPGADRDPGNKHASSKYGFLSAKLNDQAGETHVGLDNRFNGTAPEMLAHDQWFDLMTYQYPKWVSDFTYVGLLERLRQISDKDFCANGDVLTVIGEYDLKRKTGKIFYAAKGRYNTPMPASPGAQSAVVKLAWWAEDARCVVTECVNIRDFEGLDGSSSVGVFQHSIGLSGEFLDKFRSIDWIEGDAISVKTYHQLFDNLITGDGCLQLLVDDVVVDEMQSVSDDQAAAIGSYLQDVVKASGTCNGQPKSIGEQTLDDGEFYLHYSIDDGGYYLRYRWNWDLSDTDVKNLCLVTSIACKRKRQGHQDGEMQTDGFPLWETIAVNHRNSDHIWINPVFFPHPRADDESTANHGDNLNDIEHEDYGELFVSGAAILEQSLTLKVSISVGFTTISREVELQFPIETKLAISQRRSAAGGYLPAPGSSAEHDSEKQWYRDAVAD